MAEEKKTIEQLNTEFFALYQGFQCSPDHEEWLRSSDIYHNFVNADRTQKERLYTQLLENAQLKSIEISSHPKFEISPFPYLPSQIDKTKTDRKKVTLGKRQYEIYPDPIANRTSTNLYLIQDLASKEWHILKQFKENPAGDQAQRRDKEWENLSILKREKWKGELKPYGDVLIMERMAGIPLDKLNLKNFNGPQIFHLILLILKEAKRLLDLGILHRDIKPDNIIFIPHLSEVRFIDVGESVITDETKIFYDKEVVSSKFSAPMLDFTHTYSESTEVFSLGATIDWILKESNRRDPKIEKYVNAMKRHVDWDRPSLEKCIEKFEKFESNYLSILKDFKNVGIVNIDELDLKDEKFLSTLRLLDSVWLIGKKSSIDKQHLGKISEDLAQQGILLAGTIATESSVADSVDFIENNSQSLNRYFYVTKSDCEPGKYAVLNVNDLDNNIKIKNHDVYLSLKQFDFVMKSLSEEIERLKTRKNSAYIGKAALESRAGKINAKKEELRRLYADQKLTYKTLQAEIDQLQKEMAHTNPLKRLFSIFVGIKTESHKKLSEIPAKIHKWSIRTKS